MRKAITKFRGDYFFLSNFYIAPVFYHGIRFENSEAAFQAAKCPERMHEFCGLNPSDAKRLGRSVELRQNWEEIKYDVMYQVCKAKFLQNSDLKHMLIETGDAELVESNTWGDTIWGICNGVGENHLGKILMRIREELQRLWIDPLMCFTDEVGGEHEGGCGWHPDGTPCGECSRISCGACRMYLSTINGYDDDNK